MAGRSTPGVVLLTFRTAGTQKAAEEARKTGDALERTSSKAGQGAHGLAMFSGGLEDIVGGFLPFETGLGRLSGGLDDFSGKLEGNKGKAKAWAGGLAVAGGAAAAGFVGAVADGIGNAVELDSATSTVSAKLGLTEAESARIGEVAGGLYADAYGDSLGQVADVAGQVVSSIDGMRDASAESLEDMTEHALNFAEAFEVDTARSTQVVGQLLRNGLAKDGEEAFDLLTKTMQQVPTNVRDDIMDAADEYGPFFSQLGLDGASAFGLLAKGAEDGMYGIDKTGDALKELTIRSTDMSKSSAAAYEAMGLDAEKMSAMMLAGGDEAAKGFDKIVDGLLSIEDPVEQSQAALALFGTPLEDLGTDEIPGFLQSLQDGAGGIGDFTDTAAEMGDKLNSGPAKSWEKLGRLWDDATSKIGEKLLPVIEDLTEWMAANPELMNVIIIGLGILAVALGVAAVAVWAVNSALFASPITWIILGIVALIAALVLLVMNWDAVVAWISEVWGGFVNWLVEVGNGIATWWNDLWAGIGNYFQVLWTSIVVFFTTKWMELMSFVDGIRSFFEGVFGGIGDFISSAFNNALNVVKGVINGIISLVNGAIGAINSLSVTIPDWVPIVGGQTWGVNLPSIPYLARGGDVEAGHPYVVGDAGYPELFVPESDGHVYPRVPTMSGMSMEDISASLDDADVVVTSSGDRGPRIIQVVMPDGRVLLEAVLEEGEDAEARL